MLMITTDNDNLTGDDDDDDLTTMTMMIMMICPSHHPVGRGDILPVKQNARLLSTLPRLHPLPPPFVHQAVVAQRHIRQQCYKMRFTLT